MGWSKETKHFIIAYCIMATVLAIIGFCIETAAGYLMLCASALFGIGFGLHLRGRNRQINRMVAEIDMVLHNAEHIYISEGDEGELSILQSEIVKMIQRIREQNDALRREKTHLADSLADIAHQLRTPLTSVNMVLSFLESCENITERKELLREVDSLLGRMDSLLTTLLKLSRLDAGVIELRPEQVPVSALIENALHPLQIPMELREVAVQVSIPQNAKLTVDPTWFSEALQNILKNCMESVGRQGLIEIDCEDNLLYTTITIRDNGKGFRDADISHLFERFYRGQQPKATGFGIGLALAKTIIVRHGGLITASNHPAGGALFTMKFYK